MIPKFRFRLAAGLALSAIAVPLTAQTPADPAAQLSTSLLILSQNPRDLDALIGAGMGAIAVGDGNAALSFLARAEEQSPRNGRIKAALGSALVLLERPGEALKLFAEASALGIPDVDIARDRGLAYDLRGDSRRAQRDYLIANRFAPEDETTRRLALSYGISGDKAHALSLLDPLLHKQDQAAWRARAFVLAMNGDMAGAEDVARQVMPMGSETMSGFLRKLATLNAAERALAVTFGTMPSDGTRYAAVETGDPFRPAGGSVGSGVSAGLVPAGDPLGARPEDAPPARVAEPVSRDPRRRPGGVAVTSAAPPPSPGFAPPPPPPSSSTGALGRRIGTRVAEVDRSKLPVEAQMALGVTKPTADTPRATIVAKDAFNRPTQQAGTAAAPPPPTPAVAPPSPPPPPPPAVQQPSAVQAALFELPPAAPAQSPPVETVVAAATERVDASPPAARVAGPPADTGKPVQTAMAIPDISTPPGLFRAPPDSPPKAAAVEPEPARVAPSPPPVRSLAAIISEIEPEPESAPGVLPSAAELRAARLAVQKKAAAKAKADAEAKAEKDAKEAERQKAAKNPARIWVQIATGNNEAGLPGTWKRIRDQAPAAFKGLSAASVPFKATNRLLVGPLKSQAEARTLLNAMQKAGLSGSTYSSEAGQEVARIAAK